ncbi:MAG TPA: glycosyltransferase family 2 protein [Methylotenera sp.]|nr:glycosyltransferase family 2 protein [Methylotenera sp.]
MTFEEQQDLWSLLDARDKTVQNMSTQLVEKEAVIQQLNTTLTETQATLTETQAALTKTQTTLIKKITRKIKRLIAPRLGNLNQYGPIPLRDIPTQISSTAQANFPTISIVTPSFRQGHFIERTLLSVLNQKYPKLEYHVQDGGSSDNTIAILKRYEDKLSGWVSQKDSGQSQAINLGFANTSGEIMAWLNSDDLLLPGALAVVTDYFHKHPEVDVVYGNRLLIDETDMEIGRWIMPGHDSDVLSWVDYVPQETMFWRRSIWDKVGGQIDESFRFAMDWDLLVRFRDAGAKFAHIPRFLGAFRIHECQKTSAAINEIGHQEMDRIRERLLGRVPSRKEVRKAALPYLLKHVAVDLIYRIKTRLVGK